MTHPRRDPHWLDRLYVRRTPPASFFADGWGDRDAIERVLNDLSPDSPPPAPAAIRWERERRLPGALVREGSFATPVDPAGLCAESARAHVRVLLPRGEVRGVYVMLAATGDQGYQRRTLLTLPLLRDGIGAVILENPYYGLRRPSHQRGVAVRTVSELLTMGHAAVAEARALLAWLRAEGHARVGVTGYSMGGQMAAITAALSSFPVATVPASAPHSARVVFVEGLLQRATAWGALAEHGEDHASARARLGELLERTSAMRLPVPRAPEACVVMAARDDGYVLAEAVERLHAHWPGAELRWLPGGHVSGFVQGASAMRRGLRDALARLPTESHHR